MPDEVKILLRLSEKEAELVRKAAKLEERSVNQWMRMTLVKSAKGYAHLPPEA